MTQIAARMSSIVIVCFLLLGCEKQPLNLACLPEAAKANLANSDGPASAPVTNATIYIDGSGSIAGYVGNSGPVRPYEDLVEGLRDLVPDAVPIDYRRIGSGVTPIPSNYRPRLLLPGFYLCRAPDAPQPCDNDESAIDDALQEIANAPADRLSLIVTDLWFRNSDTLVTSSVAYMRPLSQVLRRGQNILIYGIVAPYRGRLYDLPSGDPNVLPARRPIYLVAVGPPQSLDRLHRKMLDSGSRYLREGLGRGTVPFTLFAIDPRNHAAVAQAGFAQPERGPIASRRFVLGENAPRDQFILSMGRIEGTNDEGPNWSGPVALHMRQGALWDGETEPMLQIWKHGPGACDYSERQVEEAGWSPTSARATQTFTVRPRNLSRSLGPGTFVLTGSVVRRSLTRDSPATEWMRQWSFFDEQESAARARTDFFPTLNLAELARLMEASLDEASAGAPLAGFTVLLKIEE